MFLHVACRSVRNSTESQVLCKDPRETPRCEGKRLMIEKTFEIRRSCSLSANSVCARTAEFSIFRTFSYVSCVCVASPQRKCRFDLVERNNEVADKDPELCVACATADRPASRPRGPDSEPFTLIRSACLS